MTLQNHQPLDAHDLAYHTLPNNRFTVIIFPITSAIIMITTTSETMSITKPPRGLPLPLPLETYAEDSKEVVQELDMVAMSYVFVQQLRVSLG